MRVIKLDTNKVVVELKWVGDDYKVQDGEFESDTGNMGQIQQADGSFVDPPPKVPTLDETKQAKLDQINSIYNQKLEVGFTSSATGTAYTFGYGATDQMKFMQLAILVLNNIATWPMNIPAKDGTLVSHAESQYQQLVKDIAAFAQPLNDKQHSFISQVNACTTIDQVNAITIQF